MLSHIWITKQGSCILITNDQIIYLENETQIAYLDNKAGLMYQACADLEIVVRGGPNLISFLVDDGIEDPNAAVNGPSSARQRNAIEMANAGGPMMAQY